ncbi:MAG: thioredoxin domain-containing protein [Cyanobacteria bacterium SZAS TMP-1]|nr:thioredoxin domain-containing protein [Cyanobacteria bacterium SZAS TMP-1]
MLKFCLAAGLSLAILLNVNMARAASGNHLVGQVSPYLLEHAHDPVNWYPWGEEAFARAKKENKPVFLSSGFAACHWCHVMQRESFSDAQTAKFLNDNFISIKVDREERPDVDEVYTRAAQAVGGRAGWPLTVFLTPDKKAFFASTYFPKEQKFGLPPFRQVLQEVLKLWRDKRGVVDQTTRELSAAIAGFDDAQVQQSTAGVVRRGGKKFLERVDREWGGISGERKFALPGALTLALQLLAATPRADWDRVELTKGYKQYLVNTLEHMARGGIRDQLRGGFFRYSTDAQWHVPHFEKMLSDNALIAQCYLKAGRLLGREDFKSTGLNTVDFCLKQFAAADGAFYGSTDADSGGREGAYYTFTPAEIESVLGPLDGKFFCTVYGIKAGAGVLYMSAPPESLAALNKLSCPQFLARLESLKAKLLSSALVQKRARPRVDIKVVTAWNGLMISALVEAYRSSGDSKYLTAAHRCQDFIDKNMIVGKQLRRVFAAGKARVDGCLDDYAFEIRALLDLAEVDKSPRWLKEAGVLNEEVLAHFVGPRVGFYYTASGAGADRALIRTGCAEDSGIPSAAAIEVSNLLRLYKISLDKRLLAVAESAIKHNSHNAEVEPAAYGYFLCAIQQLEKAAAISPK